MLHMLMPPVRRPLKWRSPAKNAVMPTIVRLSDKPYRWKVGEASLKRVANKEKMMPRSFISSDGFGITARCRRYLEPLIRGQDYPPYHRNGLTKIRPTLKTRRSRKNLPNPLRSRPPLTPTVRT